MSGAQMAVGVTGLAGLFALAYLPLTSAAESLRRTAIKTVPLALLALCGFALGAPLLLGVGLALSALGDLALSRPGERAFLMGLVSFALAHVCYLLLFWGAVEAVYWPGALGLALFALSSERWLSPYTGALRWPVRVYVMLICAMVIAALSLPAGLHLATLGAVMFLVSDLILSLQLFRMKEGTQRARIAGYALWGLYIAGQMAIFWAFLPRGTGAWGLS
ncbi:lysoplasmalogenase [Celeribacter neptunius]|uniref:YhhN-like protein n=1 Tax=Celeribacter neptunius TaxID=588602 RepID=A0A1I3J274_9RHOB|nr:lysoplasmalogenase [Celeribacter neptunius]SFI54038.1 YhhN-like protein [Celeribacter neptunius]